MINVNPNNIHGLPIWEPLKSLAGQCSPEYASCTCKDSDGNIYYYTSFPGTSGYIYKYDIKLDAWFQLSGLAPQTYHSGSSNTAVVGACAMKYKEHGYYSRAIAGGTNWIQGAFFGLNGPCRYKIRIVAGTGAGQERWVTSVDPAVVEDIITDNGGSLDYSYDPSKSYPLNSYAGYQLRFLRNAQTRILLKSNAFNNLFIYNSTSNLVETKGVSKYCMGVGPRYDTIVIGDTATIESSKAYISENWNIVPDRSSVFQLMSGSLYLVTMPTEYISFVFTQYNLLSNSFKTLSSPDKFIHTAYTYHTNYFQFHITLESIDESLQDDIFDSGTVESGTIKTLVDANKSFPINKYTNCRLFITKGTGAGQQRTIGSNTSTTLNVNIPFDIVPSNDSEYEIKVDSDKLYFMYNGVNRLFQYSVEFNDWTLSRVLDEGITCDLAVETNTGNRYPITTLSRSGSDGNAAINTTGYNALELIENDSVKIYGASDSNWNITSNATGLVASNPNAFIYQVSGSPTSPATPAKTHQPMYPKFVTVTGTLSPDATGVYVAVGIANGYPYWTNGTYYLWHHSTAQYWWGLSTGVNIESGSYWFLNNATQFYNSSSVAYDPLGTATGTATLTKFYPSAPYYKQVLVSGSLTPDATGVYDLKGISNGYPYYQRGSDNWFIYRNVNSYWVISNTLQNWDSGYWGTNMSAIIDLFQYTPNIYTGTAIVANILPQTYYNEIQITGSLTGTLSPDATGIYTYKGMYNGYPYYQRGNNSWYVFMDITDPSRLFYLSQGMPSPSSSRWYKPRGTSDIISIFGSWGSGGQYGATGSPFVSNRTSSGIALQTTLDDCVYNFIYQSPTLVDCTKNWVPNSLVGKSIFVPNLSSGSWTSRTPYEILANTETTITANFHQTITNDIGPYFILEPNMFGEEKTGDFLTDGNGTSDYSSTPDTGVTTVIVDSSKNWTINKYKNLHMYLSTNQNNLSFNASSIQGIISSNTSNSITAVWGDYNTTGDIPTYGKYSILALNARLTYNQNLVWVYNSSDEDNKFRYMYLTPTQSVGLQRYDFQTETWDRYFSFKDPKYIDNRWMMCAYDGNDTIYILDGMGAYNSAINGAITQIYGLDIVKNCVSNSYRLTDAFLYSTYIWLAPGNRMEILTDTYDNKYLYFPVALTNPSYTLGAATGNSPPTFILNKRLQIKD